MSASGRKGSNTRSAVEQGTAAEFTTTYKTWRKTLLSARWRNLDCSEKLQRGKINAWMANRHRLFQNLIQLSPVLNEQMCSCLPVCKSFQQQCPGSENNFVCWVYDIFKNPPRPIFVNSTLHKHAQLLLVIVILMSCGLWPMLSTNAKSF